MKDAEKCTHCGGVLGGEGRAVKGWFAGRWLHGEACKACWSRRLLGSLLYQADLCRRPKNCRCGWCADWLLWGSAATESGAKESGS